MSPAIRFDKERSERSWCTRVLSELILETLVYFELKFNCVSTILALILRWVPKWHFQFLFKKLLLLSLFVIFKNLRSTWVCFVVRRTTHTILLICFTITLKIELFLNKKFYKQRSSYQVYRPYIIWCVALYECHRSLRT